MGVFVPFTGLEKNKPLPATGVSQGLKTTSTLRPGNATDKVKIPIYEADDGGAGQRAANFNLTYTGIITGENIPALIPEGSDVEVTLKCADSGWELSVYFPVIDYTEEIAVPRDTKQDVTEEYLRTEIQKGEDTLAKLRRNGCDVEEASAALENVRKELENGSDQCAAEAEWPTTEKKLRSAMKTLEEDNAKYGDSQTTREVEELRRQVNQVLQSKNVSLANEVLDSIRKLNFQIARIEYYIAWLSDWNNRFDEIK